MTGQDRDLRPAGDWQDHRVLSRLVEAVAWVTWREVTIDDHAATAEGPVLLVANHFGGVSDAIVLMSVLPRRPRVLADDQIWKVPVIRNAMDALGAIPVHRGNRGSTDNTDMFASAEAALSAGEMVLIFPEGITREEPSIGKVRSGAARIAVGAALKGITGIRIVPVGIHYDNKAAFRSAVYVREGKPIDVDAELGDAVGGSDQIERRAVKDLTALIETRLREAAPDYDDWREARALQTASEAFLRSLEPESAVPVAMRDRLGTWLAAREPTELTDAADGYFTALDHLGVTDAWASRGSRGLRLSQIMLVLLWLMFLPYAVVGAIAWAVPTAVTWLVSKLRLAPAVMATVLPLAVLLTFGSISLWWLWLGWRSDRFAGLVAVTLVLPISFAAVMLVIERALLLWRWSRTRLVVSGARTTDLTTLRSTVVSLTASEVKAGLNDAMPPVAMPPVAMPPAAMRPVAEQP